MTWFQQLTGIPETSPDQVRKNITVDGDRLTSLANGRIFTCGQLETPTLAQLRERLRSASPIAGRISVREIIANVQELHSHKNNAGSLFQAASQFNLLEMASTDRTPEDGIGIYEYDGTQGPACAISCGAGTIYRNYFAVVNGQIGQSTKNQIDCLADLGQTLNNSGNRLWEMKNGYALASRAGLLEISNRLQNSSENELDELRKLLRIGIQWNAQVTLKGSSHTVTQAYCSALPVAYSDHPQDIHWEGFARLILEASYEATFCTALLNSLSTRSNKVFLTALGGGVFGNPTNWITNGIERALNLYKDRGLDVAIVSYGKSSLWVRQLVERFQP